MNCETFTPDSTIFPYKPLRSPQIVLVTGAAGFIGSHFVELLLSKDIRIIGVDKFTYAADTSIRPNPTSKYRLFNLDICQRSHMLEMMEQCDAVVNFAAESHVDRSIESPSGFVHSNINGVMTILDCAKQLKWGINANKDKIVLQVSTDEVYGSIDKGSFLEDSARRPRNPYSVTKATAEMMCEAYANTYGVPYLITRGSNTYGIRQYPEKLIPITLTRILCGKEGTIFQGAENNVRDWLYVEDHCKGIFHALQHMHRHEVANIAGNLELKNIDVINMCYDALGIKDRNIEVIPDRPGHDFRYSINSEKLERRGWKRESENFFKNLCEIAEWYKNNRWWWESKVSWSKT